MKKILAFCTVLPLVTFADIPATTAALSTLQQQMTQLQQQVQNDAQAIQSANQNLHDVSNQMGTLQQQINQYANTKLLQFKWVDVDNNQIPTNALVVSDSNKPLYVCQAQYSNGSGYYGNNNSIIDPGVVTDKGCVITYSGQAYLVPQYSVLTSNVPGYWINGELIRTNSTQSVPIYQLQMVRTNKGASDNSLPLTGGNEPTPLYNALAIIGGQENGNNVYICRVQINGQYFVGKAMNNTCYIATGKYEASWPVFEVLLTRKP